MSALYDGAHQLLRIQVLILNLDSVGITLTVRVVSSCVFTDVLTLPHVPSLPYTGVYMIM